MNHSPLCSRDDGKEITFTANDGEKKLRFVVPRELLDDECGDTADEAARKTWVEDHLPDILATHHATVALIAPFNRVRVEEIV